MSRDPVLFHLDGALEAVNTVLAELGGGTITESTDLGELSRRVVTRSPGRGGAAVGTKGGKQGRSRALSEHARPRACGALTRAVTSRTLPRDT